MLAIHLGVMFACYQSLLSKKYSAMFLIDFQVVAGYYRLQRQNELVWYLLDLHDH